METDTKTGWVFLSYALEVNTPVYGGGDGLSVTTVKSMVKGDSCNTAYWQMPNHLGTHVDFPRHFSPEGGTGSDYRAEEFVFSRIGCLDLGEVEPGQIIAVADIDGFDLADDIDLLLVKTGFCAKRNEPVYWQANPGFSPELANFLRGAFPRLRLLGFDSISVSSFTSREIGRAAHRSFLDNPQPILLLEDMDLSEINEKTPFKQIVVAPWQITEADGAPCTVVAEVENEE